MATDHIRYDILAQEALRGVLRTVLTDAARNGLPGDHHFYITFDTTADGVVLSERMRAQYPKEMRIVLQHQFWDLLVNEQIFEVGLSFGGVPERLVIPFAAITAFFDPSVEFGLQFKEIVETDGDAAAASTETEEAAKPARPPAEHKHARRATPVPAASVPPAAANAAAPDDDHPDKPSGGGEVVRLDRFRKK